ncbi:outer membrane lipoprotein-sorting protein [Aliikangiella sp. IMCC44359]|uniref:outer membrane lipoprotein-sorting protein n=1 Tax=Aliikangiella sp. IMCC44359 TaxID=3459125 RepID=UPI00403A9EC1
MKILMSLTLVVFSLIAGELKSKDSLSAEKIVEKAHLSAYYNGADGRSLARMKIVDANGRTQLRQFTILRKDISDGAEQKYLVVFSRPSAVKGTVFMVHKKINTDDDDRWLYLPALDLVKRISAGDKRTSFVGAHYFYEDVSGRSPNEDKHKIEKETEQYYILSHYPKNPQSVEFSWYQTKIDKKTFLPMSIDYFGENKKITRQIETLEVKNINGFPTVTKAKATNLLDGSYTLMEFKKMAYDIGLPDDLFTERSLRNPPKDWMKEK